jgi:phosphatidylglycerophosphate synthase
MTEIPEMRVSIYGRNQGARDRLARDFLASVLLVTILLFAFIRFAGETLGFNAFAVTLTIAIFVAIVGFAVLHLGTHGHARFGLANLITMVRAAITSVLGGFAAISAFSGESGEAALWLLCTILVLGLALDGIDGYCARYAGTVSRFGARFDMEVDALLILFLSATVAFFDKAGPWIVLIGAMRYIFVCAQMMSARLRRELPDSMRRKAACVVQGVCLCIMLLPPVAPPVSSVIGAVALGILTWSFAADLVFLLRRREPAEERAV